MPVEPVGKAGKGEGVVRSPFPFPPIVRDYSLDLELVREEALKGVRSMSV